MTSRPGQQKIQDNDIWSVNRIQQEKHFYLKIMGKMRKTD